MKSLKFPAPTPTFQDKSSTSTRGMHSKDSPGTLYTVSPICFTINIYINIIKLLIINEVICSIFHSNSIFPLRIYSYIEKQEIHED